MTHQQPETFGKHVGPRTAYVVNAENSPNGELTITVQCPYCHQPHQHTWPAEVERPHYQAPCKGRNAQHVNGAGYFAELPPEETNP